MSIVRSVYLAGRHPVQAVVQAVSLARPEWVLARYARLASLQLDRLHVLLSFDCDTELDIEVVEDVHARLCASGIRPSYAVPGELLERGADVYRRVAATGAEFLNHGYRAHTVYHAATRTYESTLFYDRLSPEEVREDIERGHEAHVRVLGTHPRGFRVPHFGTYQDRHQLGFLHQQLARMRYRFSSSTVPRYGLIHGPLRRTAPGPWEIPVSGCFDRPTTILDSWSFRHAPGRRRSAADYPVQFRKMIEYFGTRAGLLNYYADPSQVYDWPEFFDAMAAAAPFAASSFEQILDRVERKG